MRLAFDPAKRDRTLQQRGLDFARCVEVFDGTEATEEDTRMAYGERRSITVGRLDGRMVMVVWTEREGSRRIISLRKANEREQARYGARLRKAAIPG